MSRSPATAPSGAQSAVWPGTLRPAGAYEIVYVAGYGNTSTDVPQPIKNAMLIHVGQLYETRGQCPDSMDLPPAAKLLLQPYRILDSLAYG